MTQQEYLLDTLQYYSVNPSKRRSEVAGKCQYSTTPTSDGCAVGRVLIGDRDDKRRWDKAGGIGHCLSGIVQGYLPDIRPEWMKNMDRNFLLDIQSLHDAHIYWEKKGLSKYGQQFLERMIKEFKLDKTEFIQYLNN